MPSIDVGLIITAVNNATNSIQSVERDVKSLGTTSQATANRLKAIQVVIAGIVINKTLELGRAFVEVAAKNQMADIRMSNFAGSAKAASGIMEHFTQSIAASGVQNDALADAMARLTSTGMGTQQAVRTIDNLVNGLASLGTSDITGSLDNAVTAFQRFSSKGVVTTRELNSIITNTGITVQEMSDAMGISVTQFYEKLQDKTLSAQTLLDTFNKVAEQKFGGFVSLLGGTVGGAINKFKFNLDEALGSLGSRTNLNAGIVTFIQNLENAVTGFINSIKPSDVDAFFQMLRDAEPTVRVLINAMLTAGEAVITLADVTARFLNMLPKDALEFGIIGYVLLGKKGAMLGALIGTITNAIPKVQEQQKSVADKYNALPETNGSKYQTLLDALNKSSPDTPMKNMFQAWGIYAMKASQDIDNYFTPSVQGATKAVKDAFDSAVPKPTVTESMFGTPEQIAALKKRLQELQTIISKPNAGLTEPPGNMDQINAIEKLKTATQNTLSSISGKDQLLQMQTAGNALGQTIQGLVNQGTQWSDTLRTAATNLTASKMPAEQQRGYLEQIKSLQDQINVDVQKAIDLATKLNEIKQQQIQLDQASAQLQSQITNRDLQRNISRMTNPSEAFFSGTTAGALSDQVESQKAEYAQQILQYTQQIEELNTKIYSDPANTAYYEATIEGLKTSISLTEELANATTYANEQQMQFYSELGNAIENDVASGITGLIQGTKSLGDVARSIFGDMISLAIKYLVQMGISMLMGKAMQTAAFAANSAFASAQLAIWQPAAVAASIASYGSAAAVGTAAYQAAMMAAMIPFANGGVLEGGIRPLNGGGSGVLTGPTMFGLAGEAGSEAIMPLTRIGGKLGVRSTGGGGNSYSIVVQAIDTQSGMEFVAQQIENIEAGLSHRQVLGTRR